MSIGKKEKLWMSAGLGMTFIGCVWFVLSIAQVLDGLVMMFGYFLGTGLAISGLIVSGVYFYRWQRIQKLLQGENVLVKWRQPNHHYPRLRLCGWRTDSLGHPGNQAGRCAD